jgi:hypothetical protein
MSFWKWSRTAANNATADGSINWAAYVGGRSLEKIARTIWRRP